MIKTIKSWFVDKEDSTGKILNVQVEIINETLSHYIIESIRKELVNKIAEDFLKENEAEIKKQILQNPKFAAAVYNAIVLKVADKHL